MSAKAWNKRRQWKRVELAFHHVLRGKESEQVVIYGESFFIIGPKHPVYEIVVKL